MSHLIAFVLGIAVATVGFTGMANMVDNGVAKTQQVIKDAAN
jgi:hypothetical protein